MTNCFLDSAHADEKVGISVILIENPFLRKIEFSLTKQLFPLGTCKALRAKGQTVFF